jgi:hypothetical protein
MEIKVMGSGTTTAILNESMQTAITNNLTTLSTELGTWGGKLVPILATIVGVFVLFWLFKLGIRIVKSFATSSK